MTNELQIADNQNLQDKIHTIRGLQVMLDRDLAELYQVETRRLNEQVKRNSERFPGEFMFQLSKEEFENWKSQFATSNDKMGLRKIPYAFTEQGVSMLASVLKSKVAIDISIKIIKAFVSMRKLISQNIITYERFERIEERLSLHDKNFDKLFEALEDKSKKPSEGIFYDGQIYDAYAFINDLLKSAKSEVVLIDNYIDETVFTLFSKYPNLKIKIYTANISKQLRLDFQKYKSEYQNIELLEFKKAHDRFLIVDNNEIYHIGASLKDLGKKWFAFSKFEMEALEVLGRLK